MLQVPVLSIVLKNGGEAEFEQVRPFPLLTTALTHPLPDPPSLSACRPASLPRLLRLLHHSSAPPPPACLYTGAEALRRRALERREEARTYHLPPPPLHFPDSRQSPASLVLRPAPHLPHPLPSRLCPHTSGVQRHWVDAPAAAQATRARVGPRRDQAAGTSDAAAHNTTLPDSWDEAEPSSQLGLLAHSSSTTCPVLSCRHLCRTSSTRSARSRPPPTRACRWRGTSSRRSSPTSGAFVGNSGRG